jgi:hypothetical protein
MAPGEKRSCTLRLPLCNCYPQRVRDFGDWNTGTYIYFRPNIIICTYSLKTQIKIEHYQISQKRLYVHKRHTHPSHFKSQRCVQAYKIHVTLKLAIKTQPLTPVYYTPVLSTSSGPSSGGLSQTKRNIIWWIFDRASWYRIEILQPTWCTNFFIQQ